MCTLCTEYNIKKYVLTFSVVFCSSINETCGIYINSFKSISFNKWSYQHNTVYPKKYAHGFCFAVLCCGYTLTDFPISIRLTSLALWQSNDCPSASKATLMNMDKYYMWIHYERLHNHKKAKHNKTVCIFLGIYCMFCPVVLLHHDSITIEDNHAHAVKYIMDLYLSIRNTLCSFAVNINFYHLDFLSLTLMQLCISFPGLLCMWTKYTSWVES